MASKGWDKSEEGLKDFVDKLKRDVKKLAAITDTPVHIYDPEGQVDQMIEQVPAAEGSELPVEAPTGQESWLGSYRGPFGAVRLSEVPDGALRLGPVQVYVYTGIPSMELTKLRSAAMGRLMRSEPRATLVHWHRADDVCPLEPDGATVSKGAHEFWMVDTPATVGKGYVGVNDIQVWVPTFDNAPWDIEWNLVDRNRLPNDLTGSYIQDDSEQSIPAYRQKVMQGISASNSDAQVEELAMFITQSIPGEPSQSESAVQTAIRLLRKAYCE